MAVGVTDIFFSPTPAPTQRPRPHGVLHPPNTLAPIMHHYSPASPPSLVLAVLHSVALLSVLVGTLAGTSVARLVRPALASFRSDEGGGAS